MNSASSDETMPAVIERRMGYIWVVFPDRVTVYNYSEIEANIARQLTDDKDQVVFDLSRTRDLYSSAMGILVRIRKRVGDNGGIVCLVNVSPSINELLKSLHLDKIFPIYTTDVEFEVSRDEVWRRKLSERAIEFLFIGQVENGLCRISISGEMVLGHDMAECRTFTPKPGITMYVFDLGGVTSIDSEGAGAFMSLLDRISRAGGQCRAFAACQTVRQVLHFLGAERHLAFYDTENGALEGM